jgi:hypothetical protein
MGLIVGIRHPMNADDTFRFSEDGDTVLSCLGISTITPKYDSSTGWSSKTSDS